MTTQAQSAENMLYALQGISPHGGVGYTGTTSAPPSGSGGCSDTSLIAPYRADNDGWYLKNYGQPFASVSAGGNYSSDPHSPSNSPYPQPPPPSVAVNLPSLTQVINWTADTDLQRLSPYGVAGYFVVKWKGIDNEFKFRGCQHDPIGSGSYGPWYYSQSYQRYDFDLLYAVFAGTDPDVSSYTGYSSFSRYMQAYNIGSGGWQDRNYYLNDGFLDAYGIWHGWHLQDTAKAYLDNTTPPTPVQYGTLPFTVSLAPGITPDVKFWNPPASANNDFVAHSVLTWHEPDTLFLLADSGGALFTLYNPDNACNTGGVTRSVTIEGLAVDETAAWVDSSGPVSGVNPPVWYDVWSVRPAGRTLYQQSATVKTPELEIYFIYKELTPPPGCNPSRQKDAQLACDYQHGVLSVAWIDHPNDPTHSNGSLYVKCHPAPKAKIGHSTDGWQDTQTIETGTGTAKCTQVGLVKLPNARTILSYSRGSTSTGYTSSFRRSDRMGLSGWSARQTTGNVPLGAYEGGRGMAQAFAAQAGGFSVNLLLNRDNIGEKWVSTGAFTTQPLSGLPDGTTNRQSNRCGGAWTGQVWGFLVSDAKERVFYIATPDGTHPLVSGTLHDHTCIFTGFVGIAVALTCLAHGTLVGLVWDDTALTTTALVSYDHGKTWTQQSTGLPALACPPILVNDGDVVYAVYVDASNSPQFRGSVDAGTTWI